MIDWLKTFKDAEVLIKIGEFICTVFVGDFGWRRVDLSTGSFTERNREAHTTNVITMQIVTAAVRNDRQCVLTLH